MGEHPSGNFFQFVMRQPQGIQISQTCNRIESFLDGSILPNLSPMRDSRKLTFEIALLDFSYAVFGDFQFF